ncbi:MAG: glycoside hydrolase family 130 protein [Candidatus Marinimicrobia bacterium]|nr:glycoside hydrolase family 130 protein [Candidatus Neomarinimicrobiota bacterium]
MSLTVTRKSNRFYPDSKRVIARLFMPRMNNSFDRAQSIIQKVINLSDDDVNLTLNQILRDFAKRHRNITKTLENHFNNVKDIVKKVNGDLEPLSLKRKLLIGSYFTMEYAIESAAFFNPSIVEAPDQTDLEEGQKRIIVSFRATGEGHLSSIVFRRGIIDKNNNLNFAQPGKLVDIPEVIKRHVYNKKNFLKKLDEMHIHKDVVGMVMDRLGDTFIYGELQASISETIKNIKITPSKKKVIQSMSWLADSHYKVTFSLDTAISERVIFPVSYTEKNGIEDARFVRFIDDDGCITYYATYTAYNGFAILPKLIDTKDFYNFRILPLNGEYVQNKDLALFPRKINGKYAMISRIDGVNNYIMFSDKINLWQNVKKVQEPKYTWEFIQIGNCGSPIETEKGWLLITHAVGPMRRYSLGAILLDLEDPSKLIGQLRKPLLIPNDEEREGYVPNVVYSCGSIIHNNELIIPYAMADFASSFASVPLDELLDELLNNKSFV